MNSVCMMIQSSSRYSRKSSTCMAWQTNVINVQNLKEYLIIQCECVLFHIIMFAHLNAVWQLFILVWLCISFCSFFLFSSPSYLTKKKKYNNTSIQNHASEYRVLYTYTCRHWNWTTDSLTLTFCSFCFIIKRRVIISIPW